MREKKKKLIDYNQNCILNAAKGLFHQNGITKTTVDEIARAADCSKATIYVYFKNKDDIYYHIVLEYMTALRDSLTRCFGENKDYKSAYLSLCDTLVRFEQDNPMYFECMLGCISTEAEEMEKLPVLKTIFDVGEEINAIVCDFLESGKADGFIRPDVNSLQATFVLWSSICGLISLYANKKTYFEQSLAFTQEDFLTNGFAMILKMITNGGV